MNFFRKKIATPSTAQTQFETPPMESRVRGVFDANAVPSDASLQLYGREVVCAALARLHAKERRIDEIRVRAYRSVVDFLEIEVSYSENVLPVWQSLKDKQQ